MFLISNSHNRLLLVTFAVLTLLVLAGCGEKREPVGSISGTVKDGEKLIGDCSIAMFEPSSMRTLGATADESGEYSLEDVPFGSYQVRVYPKPTNTVDAIPDPRIPMKFRDFKKSGITLLIDSTDSKVLDINFK